MRPLKIFGFCVALLALPITAIGDIRDEIERQDLALMQQQLSQLLVVVDRIEKRQKQRTPGRYILNTELLRRDVFLLQSGINDYMLPARFPARDLEPLSGDYLKRSGN